MKLMKKVRDGEREKRGTERGERQRETQRKRELLLSIQNCL